MSVPAGWYRSKTDPLVAEFWDGSVWTGRTRRIPSAGRRSASHVGGGVAGTDKAGLGAVASGKRKIPVQQPAPPPVYTPVPDAGDLVVYKTRVPGWVIGTVVGSIVLVLMIVLIVASVLQGSANNAAAEADPVRRGLIAIAEKFDASYAAYGSYPDVEDVSGDFFNAVGVGNSVSVMFYDYDGRPSDVTMADSYVLCGFSWRDGVAYAYDSANGGLRNVGVLPVGTVSPCDMDTVFVVSGEPQTVWRVSDVAYVLTSERIRLGNGVGVSRGEVLPSNGLPLTSMVEDFNAEGGGDGSSGFRGG